MKDELVGEEYVADYILYMLNRRECFEYGTRGRGRHVLLC